MQYTRRAFLLQAGVGAGALTAGAIPPPPSAITRLILLGTAVGPTPKKTRSAPAQGLLINGVPYVVDCGNGVARQLVLAGVPL